MSKKSETPVLIVSLLVTLGLLGAGGWWLAQQFGAGNFTAGVNGSADGVSTSSGFGNSGTGNLQNRLSTGGKLLIAQEATPEKRAGIEAIASGNYAQAVQALETSLQTNPNDPEALIYLNNARIGDQPSYTIAVAAPIESSVNSALEILRGVAQAQTEVNESGGINGTPLRVMITSDSNTPESATEIANALSRESEVLGVVGHFGSEATLAAAQVYEDNELVVVSPTSTSVALSTLGDYVFRTVPSDRFTATALSRYMVNQLQKQNAAIFFNSASDYSQSLKEELTTALYSDGGQVVSEFDLAAPNFSAVDALSQAQNDGAEVLILAPNTSTLDPALQVVAVNRQQLDVLGGDSVYNPKTLQIGGQSAVGMVVAVPWHILAGAQNSEFIQASRQLWGGDVNWRTAMAYDAVMALAEGLRQNPSRAGVQTALSSNGFSAEGATGRVQFLPSGDRNQTMQLVTVQPGSRSGYGFDFVPVP